jgi:cytochrome d ubiquinol oxidase subunit II
MIEYILLNLLLFVYVILISIEFGNSIYYYIFSKLDVNISKIIFRYISPVWELTNTFLVLFIVFLVALYPKAPLIYGTVFLIPASIALFFFLLRAFSFVYIFEFDESSILFKTLYGVSSFFIPIFLVLYFSVSIFNNFKVIGNTVIYSLHSVIFSPLSIAFMGFAILNILYISAAFLLIYTKEDKKIIPELSNIFIILSLIMMFFVSLMFYIFRSLHFFSVILNHYFLIIFVYIIFFALSQMFIVFKEYKYLFLLVLFQMFLLFLIYIIGNFPYILYNNISIYNLNNSVTVKYLLYSVILAIIFIVPSLIFFIYFLKKKKNV